MKIVLQCLALAVGLAAFIPFIPASVWWVRGFDFPRMQLLVIGLVVGIALACYGVESWLVDGAVLAFLAIALGVQAWRMRPYSKLSPLEVLPANGNRKLTIFVVNVLMTNRNAERLLDLVREKGPDVILAVETDQWWVDRLGQLKDEYPHAVEIPQDDTYGMVLRSRLPLVDATVDRLLRKNIPSIHTKVQLPGGELVHLHAVHPRPPFPDEAASTTKRDAELLIVGKRAARHGGPTIVAGDLNDVAWSETTRLFQKMSGLLDPRIGRGRFNTYHASHWWLRWPLDHIFLSCHFRLRRLELQPHIGSDHFPILAELSFEPECRNEQNAPEQDHDDRKEARQKIAEAKAEVGGSSSGPPESRQLARFGH